jgi:hypothetical protein
MKRSRPEMLPPLPTISHLGIMLRTSHTPPLSRSDLVLWHKPAVVRDQSYARYGRELRTLRARAGPR